MVSLSNKAKNDLEILLSLKRSQIDDLIKIVSVILKEKRIPSEDDVYNRLKIDKSIAKTLAFSIYAISKYCSTDEKTEDFLREVKKLDFTDLQVKTLKDIVVKLKSNNIIDKIVTMSERYNIESFGLPHLSDIELMTDYRIFNGFDGKKDLVPTILCDITIHKKGKSEKKVVESEHILFQFPIEILDDIINDLQQYRESINKDIKFLEEKLSRD
jgi:hypothetical protein